MQAHEDVNATDARMAAMGNSRQLQQRSDATAGGRTVLVTGMALGVGSASIWQ
jgi:hypothetical protein